MLYAIGIYEAADEILDFQTLENAASHFFAKRPLYEKDVLKIIYSYSKSGKLKRIQTAQQYHTSFFQINQLENADKILLSTDFFSTMIPGMISLIKTPQEFNYFCRLNLKTPGDIVKTVVIVIASRKALDESEQVFLVKNITHTIVRPDSINNITIKNILENPLGYTGKEILMTVAQDKIKDVIRIMHDNIDKVIDRGEKLESLEEKSSQLNIVSLKFENSAKRLNRTCCWW